MRNLSRRFTASLPIRLLLCTVVAAVCVLLDQAKFFNPLEYALFDLRVRLISNQNEASEDIVIISVDDASIKRLNDNVGMFPWPRSVYAGIINYCRDARAIGLDIILSQHDQQFDSDELLIEEVKKNPVVSSVLLYDELDGEHINTNVLKFALNPSRVDLGELTNFRKANLPYPALLKASRGLGHVNLAHDPDDTVRRYQLVGRLQHKVYPSLALSVAMTATGLNRNDLLWAQESRRFTAGSTSVELGPDGSFYLFPYRGGDAAPAFLTKSFADVLYSWQEEANGRIPPISRDLFKDKIVLIGMTASGVYSDKHKTSLPGRFSGVYLHATAIDNLLRQQYLTKTPDGAGLLLLLALALLPAWMTGERPYRLIVLSLLGLALYVVSSFAIEVFFHHSIPIAMPGIALLVSTFMISAVFWASERIRRREMEALEAHKQQFTDMLVHDLKGGISSIVMCMSVIADPDKLSNERRERIIGTIKSSGDRLLTQVNALLDIRKMEEGRMPLDLQQVNLNEQLREILLQYRPSAQLIDLELVEDLDPNIKTLLEVDPDIFQRIMGNLVWNALQYSRKQSKIMVRSLQNGANVEVHIGNLGKVVPPGLQASLFTPFTAGKNEDRNVRSVSTGLGLAFCKLAMQAHGAEIELLSPWPDHEDGVLIKLRFPINR